MTFEKRPFLRRLSRTVRHLFPRVLVLVAMVFFSATPSVAMVRTIAAAGSSERPAQTAPGQVIDEEEPPGVHQRHHVELRDLAGHRFERVAMGEVALRHRAAWDMERAARRWERGQAAPRAPPHRLLN